MPLPTFGKAPSVILPPTRNITEAEHEHSRYGIRPCVPGPSFQFPRIQLWLCFCACVCLMTGDRHGLGWSTVGTSTEAWLRCSELVPLLNIVFVAD